MDALRGFDQRVLAGAGLHHGRASSPSPRSPVPPSTRAGARAGPDPDASRWHNVRMTTATTALPFKVADLSLAEAGRHQIRLAEHEMPGLMALREEFGPTAAAQGRAHRGLAAHDRADRGAHRDARRARRAGALGRAATSSPPRTTPPPRSPSARPAPSMRPAGVPVFAWKGETLEEYWWCTEQIFDWSRRGRRRART